MRRYWVFALAFAGTFSSSLDAQSTDTVYVGSQHSAFAAGAIEFFVPTAGFAYGGNWTRGFLPNAFRIGSFIGFGATYDEPNDKCSSACTVWSLGVLATTVWAIVGAVNTAKDHNEMVREPSSLFLLEPAPGGGVSFGVRLRR